MRRTYKRRTSRLVKRNPYRQLKGVIPTTSSGRYYAPLPYQMKVAIPWYLDTRHMLTLDGGTSGVARTKVFYWIWDPINMGLRMGPDSTASNPITTSNQYPYSAQHYAMFNIYTEMKYRTTVYNMEFQADFHRIFANGTAANILAVDSQPSVSMIVGVLPQTYLKRDATTYHDNADTGVIYPNATFPEVFDYHSILSNTPGSKQLVLPVDGSQDKPLKTQLSIDAYEHIGAPLSATGIVNWDQGTARPGITMSWPNPGTRSFVVCAVRVRYMPYGEADQRIFIRSSVKVDQHVTMADKIPSAPYSTTAN